jgi:hypothetical protein
MEAVAKFYASRKMNDKPSRSVAEAILRIVWSTLVVLTNEGFSDEKVFGILEKTGLLGSSFAAFPLIPKVLLR